jgi:L-2,4-diaminobutyrate decarboxylase
MPETNILCFRIGEDDDIQLKIRVKLLQAGNFYISTTLYKGKRWLRLVFLNPSTTLKDIKRLTDEISIIHNKLLQNSIIHNEELG